MKVVGKRGDVRVTVPSSSGKDLGLFLLFLGWIASWPAQYLVESFWDARFVEVKSWMPATIACGVLTCLGLLSIFNTHKVLHVRGNAIRIQDGWFRKPLQFNWQDTPSIRLRAIEQEQRRHVFEVWQVTLLTGNYEYLLDARANQQLISRYLAEVLAKGIGCNLVEKDGSNEIVMPPDELDTPYSERVAKYPQLLGTPVPPPRNPRGVTMVDVSGETRWRWGLQANWLLTEIFVLVLIALGLSLIPLGGEKTLFANAAATGDWTYFYIMGVIMLIAMVVVPGYEAQLRINHDRVTYQALIWRIPVITTTIPIAEVEELRLHDGLRGPILQLISDKQLISFRIADREIARWIAYEVGSRLMRNVPA